MHIYYIFFRFMLLHVSVLGDHPQGAHYYRVHQCYHVQNPIYKYLQQYDVSPEHRIVYEKWRLTSF